MDAPSVTWNVKNVSEHVTFPNIPVAHTPPPCRIYRETGIAIRATRRSATAMLTNRKPVSDLVSGLLLMMKIRRRFPTTATNMVIEYSTVKIVLCRELGPGDCPSEEFSVSVEFIVVFIVIFKSVLLDVSKKKIRFLSPTPRTYVDCWVVVVSLDEMVKYWHPMGSSTVCLPKLQCTVLRKSRKNGLIAFFIKENSRLFPNHQWFKTVLTRYLLLINIQVKLCFVMLIISCNSLIREFCLGINNNEWHRNLQYWTILRNTASGNTPASLMECDV